jgi:hypothetical protein
MQVQMGLVEVSRACELQHWLLECQMNRHCLFHFSMSSYMSYPLIRVQWDRNEIRRFPKALRRDKRFVESTICVM